MAQIKNLTREQKVIATKHGLIASQWHLKNETDSYLVLIHKDSKRIKTIDKYAGIYR